MKNLKTDIKNIFAGLSYQHAGEFQSLKEKKLALDHTSRSGQQQARAASPIGRKKPGKRIALLSDGRGQGAPLDYVIDTCIRQDAFVDLLIHGVQDVERVTFLENRLRDARIDFYTTQLGIEVIRDVRAYINTHSSLLFLVAMPEDDVATRLVEDLHLVRRRRTRVPIVLIEERATAGIKQKSVV